jgi:4'-phosphopantetheinyl transferase
LVHNNASVNGDCSEIMSVPRSDGDHPGYSPSLELPGQTIDIWYCSLAAALNDVDFRRLAATLSPQELEKSRRFKRPQDQLNYVLQRGCLRYILGGYAKQPPAALEFSYGDYGKPDLVSNALNFNLSHTQQRLAIAASPSFSLGMDLEYHKPLSRFEALCQRCLTPAEQQGISTLDLVQAQRLFFHYWTCKEAYLKGVGVGLTVPMTEVEMQLPTLPLPTIPTSTVMATTHSFQPGWQIYPWQPEADYSAALAVKTRLTTTPHPLTFRLYQTSPTELIHQGTPFSSKN